MTITKNKELTAVFEKNLPYKPYCSNTKNNMKILPKEIAIRRKYIQYNNPHSIKWLAYDCDYAGALEHIGNNQLPAPTIAVVNKANGRSHLFYGLETPVCITDKGKRHPKDFLKAINYELSRILDADPDYTQFISKNPLNNELWETLIINPNLWELNDFLEYLTPPIDLPKKANYIGVGRNCTTFDCTRQWAYRQVLSYKISSNQAAFHKAVLEYCEEFNKVNFPTNPLHYSEIKAIAKSISKWTWTTYTGRWTDTEFSTKQSKRGKSGGKASGNSRLNKSFENRVMANLYSMMGMSLRQVSSIMNTPKSTIELWIKP